MNLNKTRFILAALLIVAVMLSGCSVFVSTPRVARYHVQGLDDRMTEFVIPLDTQYGTPMDIELSDRYAVQFDFEWLWNTEPESSEAAATNDTTSAPSLAPWMICKYRF